MPMVVNPSRFEVAPSGGFSPVDLFGASEAGIVIDPSTGIFQEIAETNPSDSDSDVVGRWKDQSGNAHNLDQATTSAKPLWHTGAGLSWVSFDGANDYLAEVASLGLYDAGEGYVALAIDTPSMNSNDYIFMEGNSGTSTPIYAPFASNSSNGDATSVMYRTDASATKVSPTTVLDSTALSSTPSKKFLEFIDTGTGVEIFVGGVSGDGASNPSDYASRDTTILNQFALGCLFRASASSFSTFSCYGLTALGRIPTAGERADMKTYYDTKLGI